MRTGGEPTFEEAPECDDRLIVELGGYEGPIDVLLSLAREQRVDLTRLSILALADQYLAFVERVRGLRLELAADYLVMAAWLAYLKSRLLLPEPPADEEPTAAEMAQALTFQLLRLEAMQAAGARLLARPLLNRDVFPRGEPEGIRIVERPVIELSLFDLLSAYADHRRKGGPSMLRIEPLDLYSIDEAIGRLTAMLGRMPDWTTLWSFLPSGLGDGIMQRSAIAATLAASLELARSGKLQIRQERPFGPIYFRKTPDVQ
ncbi:MAG: segregation/condensation protein A [Rhodospirillaceae bacterium]|nr:segregation/condensation protein A [Rhodospirillaceae bacterium]